jgi:SAM-dependent methyltransferase
MMQYKYAGVLCTAQDRKLRQVSLWNCILGVIRQLKTERSLRKRHVSYRTTEPARVAEAYGSMSEDEFDSINGPQEWQNRRFIPRVIQSLRIREPVLAVDLGCGSGQSSQVLGSQLPPGSTLLGYDICDRLLARASHRTYRDVRGAPLKAHFMNQPIAQPLHNPEGRRLDAGSVGLVHAAGVVGHHLAEADVRAMAAEIARVLMHPGWVVLDAGPAMPRGCPPEDPRCTWVRGMEHAASCTVCVAPCARLPASQHSESKDVADATAIASK